MSVQVTGGVATTNVYTSSSSAVPTLPYHQRTSAVRYTNADGTVGEVRFPINYEELSNLKGRLLTLIDATYIDPEQRKAQKDVVWQTLRAWMDDIQRAAGYNELGPPPEQDRPVTDPQQS